MLLDLLVRRSTLRGEITAPGSKSVTHRSLIIASLAEGSSKLKDALLCADTRSTISALRRFGIEFPAIERGCIEVRGRGGRLDPPGKVLSVGNSGTSLRLLTTVAGLAKGMTVITGDESLRSRPMGDLLEALSQIGLSVAALGGDGRAPIRVRGTGTIPGGRARIRGSTSSQFVSSVLIPSPYFERGLDLVITGQVRSRPYIELTIETMEEFGVGVERTDEGFSVRPRQTYASREYKVDGDYSSAAFVMAAAAVTGSTVEIRGLREGSLQADEAFLPILGQMGCIARRKGDVVRVTGGELKGLDVSLSDSPDLLPAVSVLASVASGPSTIRNVEHARYKESDRIAVIHEEFRRLGIRVKETKDGLDFRGGDMPNGQEAFSHGDHRIAMALVVLGMLCRDLVVRDGRCISVSYPSFVRDLSHLGAHLEWV